MNSKKLLFIRCYYGFLISGMMVLIVGAILPSFMKAAGLSYSTAGGLLSAMAMGNLFASFINPPLTKIVGRRWTITIMGSLVPISFFGMTCLPPVPIMFLLMFAAGMGRGSISILNNAVINDNSEGKPYALNLLHSCFAVGAFLAPFLTSTLLGHGFDWRQIMYLMVVLSVSSTIFYATTEYDTKTSHKTISTNKTKITFYKSFDFYCIGFILFFYLGVENCINGWFVTYLQNIGIMSAAYAANLVSVTWLVILIGRLTCAYLSTKIMKKRLILINCLGSALCFLRLISSANLTVVTVSLIGLGFFLAGIYPTCIANAGTLIKGSTSGMALLMAIAALGGIVTPQIVGWIGDAAGLTLAISFLVINVFIMIVLAVINNFRKVIV